MKDTLRNLALGAVIMSAGAMFAQAPTVTEVFAKKLTTTEIPSLAVDTRTGTGVNGNGYALNKATGEVYVINGEGITTLDRKFDVEQYYKPSEQSALNTAITTDDAGNIIVLYANGTFWANAPYGFAIMSADGKSITYTGPVAFPEGYDLGRLDCLGRAVGNVLDKGALFLPPASGAKSITAAGFVFTKGAAKAMEYPSTALGDGETGCAGQNLSVAVPAFNSIDELLDQDAPYDALYVEQWNAAGKVYTIADDKYVSVAFPEQEGVKTNGAPGFDVINRDGDIYLCTIYGDATTNPGAANVRPANFQIFDPEGNVVYASKNICGEGAQTFINGGSLNVHQTGDDTYEVYFWGGPKEDVYATMVTLTFGEDGVKAEENFSVKVTPTDIPELATEVRSAAGANGYVYALNKATGEVIAINGEGMTKLTKTFEPVHTTKFVSATLNTAITSDDAGNLVALYGNGSFWANAAYGLAIMPANPEAEIIYTEPFELPKDVKYDLKRLDVLGRIAGNVLEKGVGFLAPANGAEGANPTALGIVFEEGKITYMEYASEALTCGGQNLNVAVPAFNSVDEILDAEAPYNAVFVQQWNAGKNVYTFNDEGKATAFELPTFEGNTVGGAPGFDVINHNGQIYYCSVFANETTNPGAATKRPSNLQITDVEGNLVFATKNVCAEGAQTFINGGGVFVHPVDENTYEVYFIGGPKEDVFVNMVKVEFPTVPVYVAPELCLRGEFNSWGVGPKAEMEGPDEDGLYTYTLSVPEFPAGEFKFGTEDWKTSFGKGAQAEVVNGEAVEAIENAGNFKMPEDGANVKFVLVVNPDYTKPSSLTVSWEVFADRAPFAYNVKAEQKEGNQYTITFKATEAGDASVVLYTAEDTEVVKALGAAVKGENSFDVTFDDDNLGEFAWALRLESKNDATVPEYAVKDIWVQGENGRGQFGRGGVVTLTDAEYDTFGYTAVAASRGIGIDIYDPEGNLVKEGLYKDTSLNTNNSSPLRGGQRLGKAVFASWADANSGYYYVDPINPAETPENILVGERNGDGLFTYEGVQTAGGSPCVGFLGKGAEQTMWLYEEDLFNNTIAIYPIGEAKQLTVAGTPLSWTTGAFAAQNMCFTPTEYGMFGCQNRANGMDEGVPAFIFMSKEGKRLVNAVDIMPEGYELPSSNGALGVSFDGSLLAIGTYNSIEFFSMEWEPKAYETYDDEGQLISTELYTVPCNLEHLYGIECNIGANINNAQGMFDAANNFHFYGCATTNGYAKAVRYAVVTLPGANVATTPAKAANKITIVSGVESIEAAAANADAVYYNLNGVRIAPENMTSGIYVKVQGAKAQKVVVK